MAENVDQTLFQVHLTLSKRPWIHHSNPVRFYMYLLFQDEEQNKLEIGLTSMGLDPKISLKKLVSSLLKPSLKDKEVLYFLHR